MRFVGTKPYMGGTSDKAAAIEENEAQRALEGSTCLIADDVVSDEWGNRAQIGYWGSDANAKASLRTNFGCRHCVDCSFTIGCFDGSQHRFAHGASFCRDVSCGSLWSSYYQIPKQDTVPLVSDLGPLLASKVIEPGALILDRWHADGDRHCLAGWVVCLAGIKGRRLEEHLNSTALAALLIAHKSGLAMLPAAFWLTEECAKQYVGDLINRSGDLAAEALL